MKRVKNIMYVIGVIVALGALIVISAVIVQLGMEVIINGIGINLNEDMLYNVSGSLSIVITGVICAIYVKRKQYTSCVGECKPFCIKTCVYYSTLAFAICSVLLYAITTWGFAYLFSMVEESQVVIEKSWEDTVLLDVLFPIFIAPIFEELLFRMGLYSLLRRRLKKGSSILVCTVIFAVMHGYSLQGLCMCFASGLIFTLIYVNTGNLWYNIVAHMTCNIAATVFNALENMGVTLFGIPVQYEVNGFNTLHPILIVISIILCGVCIIKSGKCRKTDEVETV